MTPQATQVYVNSLRGENDLAHGSLIVPPMATLSDLVATLAAEDYSGSPPTSYSTEELSGLVGRTGGDAAELTALVCQIPGITHSQIKALIPEANSLPATLPDVSGVDDMPDLLAVWRSADCLGNHPSMSAADRLSIEKAIAQSPLIALSALDAGIVESENVLSASGRTNLLRDLDHEVTADGCDEEALEVANALAALGAELTPVLQRCAATPDLVLSRSSSLNTLRMAHVKPSQVASLLKANRERVHEWTMVRESLLQDWPSPVGFGTLEATRDAVALLTLTDNAIPTWIGDGVALALTAYSTGELVPVESQGPDLLYLCATVIDQCPADLQTLVEGTATRLDTKSIPNNDATVARLFDALTAADLALPVTCTPELAHRWAMDAPLTLVALSATQDDCVTMSGVTEQEFAARALESLQDGKVDESIAYSRLRKQLVPVVRDDEQYERMAAEWARLVEKLRKADTDEYLEKGQPLSFVLRRAELFDALE